MNVVFMCNVQFLLRLNQRDWFYSTLRLQRWCIGMHYIAQLLLLLHLNIQQVLIHNCASAHTNTIYHGRHNFGSDCPGKKKKKNKTENEEFMTDFSLLKPSYTLQCSGLMQTGTTPQSWNIKNCNYLLPLQKMLAVLLKARTNLNVIQKYTHQ